MADSALDDAIKLYDELIVSWQQIGVHWREHNPQKEAGANAQVELLSRKRAALIAQRARQEEP